MRAKQFITELYNRPYELQARKTGFANIEYLFQLEDGRPGRIMFDSFIDDSEGMMKLLWVQVHFYIDDEHFYAGGDTAPGVVLRIFATVKAACDLYLAKTQPPLVVFESEDPKKRSIYLRMARQFPGYVPYANWKQDPLANDIMDASAEGLVQDMVVLRRQDYQPRPSNLSELAPDDSYSGNDDDRIIPWEQARAAIEQFAEDSNAVDFHLENNGKIAVTIWGPELGAPYSDYAMYISPQGDGAMSGILFGIYSDGVYDIFQKFIVPQSMNGVDHAARIAMQVRM